MKSLRSHLFAASIFFLCAHPVAAGVYYVSPGGLDTNNGTSTTTPWKTFAPVNARILKPGDQVLLQGGQIFPVPSTGNVVQNPGFESNSTAWIGKKGATISSASPQSGTFSAAIRTGSSASQSIKPVPSPGATFSFSFWGRMASSTEQGFVTVTFNNASGKKLGKAAMTVKGTTYQLYRMQLMPPPSTASVVLSCTKTAGTELMYLDDFLMEATNTLVLDSADSGTAASPVKISTYGTEMAEIRTGNGLAVLGRNVSGIDISNLRVVGPGAQVGVDNGISLFSDPGKVSDTVRILNVEATGFGDCGIYVEGYRNIRIIGSDAHDNGLAGIEVAGVISTNGTYSNQNLYIGDCSAIANAGVSGLPYSSGSGFVISGVNNGTVERCVATGNGQLNTANGGPIGFLFFDSKRITVQHNESYDNRTGSLTDGGGFDFDGGVTDSVMQYNYSHGNDGAGYLLACYPGARPNQRNVIRYNVSQNDGRKNQFGGIQVWNGGGGMSDFNIYHNTVYGGTSTSLVILSATSGMKVWNNIFFNTNDTVIVNVAPGQVNPLFAGNDYWPGGGILTIRWGLAQYKSLDVWRTETGMEQINSVNTGLSVAPVLLGAGAGPTFGDAAQLETLDEYQIGRNSPLRNVGVSVSDTFAAPATSDFFGTLIPQGAGPDVGAHEYNSPID